MNKFLERLKYLLEKYSLILIVISMFWCSQLILGEYYPRPMNIFFAVVNLLGVIGLLLAYFKPSERAKAEWFFPGDVVEVNDAVVDNPHKIIEKYRWTVKAFNPHTKEIHAMNDDNRAYTFEPYQVVLVSRSRKLIDLTDKESQSYKDPRYKHD